jgi:predicted dehydrogenase
MRPVPNVTDQGEQLRIGIIGVNGIGVSHLWSLKMTERSRAAAVCDIDAARAEKAGTEHEVRAFTEPAAMYESGLIDAVVIATPAGTHPALAREALDAGMHVYCEKPVAPMADDGYALARHAYEAGRTLQIGFQFRFHKGYAALRDLAATVAPLTRLNLSATNWFRPQYYFDASTWRGTWEAAGGGVLMNQAIHQLDAFVSIAGLPARVTGQVRTVRHRAAVEDDAIALLEWSSGATGVLVASLNDPAGYERIELFGDLGAVRLDDGYDLRVTEHDDAQRVSDELASEFPELVPEWTTVEVPRRRSEWLDCMIDAHRDFANAVLDGRTPLVDGEEGTRAVELANAIYLSAIEERPVDLPLERGEYRPCYEQLTASGLTR